MRPVLSKNKPGARGTEDNVVHRIGWNAAGTCTRAVVFGNDDSLQCKPLRNITWLLISVNEFWRELLQFRLKSNGLRVQIKHPKLFPKPCSTRPSGYTTMGTSFPYLRASSNVA